MKTKKKKKLPITSHADPILALKAPIMEAHFPLPLIRANRTFLHIKNLTHAPLRPPRGPLLLVRKIVNNIFFEQFFFWAFLSEFLLILSKTVMELYLRGEVVQRVHTFLLQKI